jgi:hypothetical protein
MATITFVKGNELSEVMLNILHLEDSRNHPKWDPTSLEAIASHFDMFQCASRRRHLTGSRQTVANAGASFLSLRNDLPKLALFSRVRK